MKKKNTTVEPQKNHNNKTYLKFQYACSALTCLFSLTIKINTHTCTPYSHIQVAAAFVVCGVRTKRASGRTLQLPSE